MLLCFAVLSYIVTPTNVLSCSEGRQTEFLKQGGNRTPVSGQPGRARQPRAVTPLSPCLDRSSCQASSKSLKPEQLLLLAFICLVLGFMGFVCLVATSTCSQGKGSPRKRWERCSDGDIIRIQQQVQKSAIANTCRADGTPRRVATGRSKRRRRASRVPSYWRTGMFTHLCTLLRARFRSAHTVRRRLITSRGMHGRIAVGNRRSSGRPAAD